MHDTICAQYVEEKNLHLKKKQVKYGFQPCLKKIKRHHDTTLTRNDEDVKKNKFFINGGTVSVCIENVKGASNKHV